MTAGYLQISQLSHPARSSKINSHASCQSQATAHLGTFSILTMRKVLLFGLSGNPPTGPDGHGGIVEYFVRLERFEDVWIVPVYRHMFSEKRKAMEGARSPTYGDRVEMCRMTFEKHSTAACKVTVKRTEEDIFMEKLKELPPGASPESLRVSSFDLLRYLRARHPNEEFYFLVGTDTYQDIRMGKWRKSQELMGMVKFVVVDRLGVKRESMELLKGMDVYNPPMITDISSTKVRNASVSELLQWPSAVDEQVLRYMSQKRLYGFGRQSWLERSLAEVSRFASTGWILGAASLFGTLGVIGALCYSRRQGRQAS